MGNSITIEKYSKDTVLKGDVRKVYFKIKNPQNYHKVKFSQLGKNAVEPVNQEYRFDEVATTGLFDENGFAKVMEEYNVKYTYKGTENNFSFTDTYYIKEREVIINPQSKQENALIKGTDHDFWIAVPSIKGKYLVSVEDMNTEVVQYIESDSQQTKQGIPFKHYTVNTKLDHIQLSVSTPDSFILASREYHVVDIPKGDVVLLFNGAATDKRSFTTQELAKLEIGILRKSDTKDYKVLLDYSVDKASKSQIEKREAMEGNLLLLKANAKSLKSGDVIHLKATNLQLWPITPGQRPIPGESSKSPEVYSIALDKEFVINIK